MIADKPIHTRGAALMLVLWAIAVVGFAVVWLASIVGTELETGAVDSTGLRARLIAVSGVALGLHPQVKPDDTELLNRDLGGGEEMHVRIRGEGGRLNINKLLEQRDRNTLQNLFVLWGMNSDEADRLIDKLIDWVDDDAGRGLNGAEQAEYEAAGIPDAPTNRPFRSVSEMQRVLDMDKLAALKPDWADYFTIFGDGRVDVNEASPDVLQAVTGMTPEAAAALVKYRAGEDGVQPSEDDFKFEDVKQAAGWLQSSRLPAADVASRISTESSVKRIDSRGIVGDREIQISVVAAQGGESGGETNYLLWEEK